MKQKRNQRGIGGGGGRTKGVAMLAGMAMSCLAGLSTARAQFHAKTQNGQVVAAQPNPVAATANNPNAPTVYRSQSQNAGFVNTNVEGARLGYTDFRNAVVWGRALFHPDGTYTESKQDSATNSLTQETMSPNGVMIQRRLISLDAKGRPSEILIYDGRGNYKYRGQILYDNLGRFQEEQIYDTKNQLLRNRIQKYDLQGKPERLVVVEDRMKIPADLKLVITDADGVAQDAETAQRNLEEFQRNATATRVDDAAQPAAEGATSEKKKPGFFRRMFNKD